MVTMAKYHTYGWYPCGKNSTFISDNRWVSLSNNEKRWVGNEKCCSFALWFRKRSRTRISQIPRILFVASNGDSHLVSQWKNSEGVKIREMQRSSRLRKIGLFYKIPLFILFLWLLKIIGTPLSLSKKQRCPYLLRYQSQQLIYLFIFSLSHQRWYLPSSLLPLHSDEYHHSASYHHRCMKYGDRWTDTYSSWRVSWWLAFRHSQSRYRW